MQSSKHFQLNKNILPSDVAFIAKLTESSYDYSLRVIKGFFAKEFEIEIKGSRASKSKKSKKIIFCLKSILRSRNQLEEILKPIELLE